MGQHERSPKHPSLKASDEMTATSGNNRNRGTRRGFLQAGSALVASSLIARNAHAGGSDEIRIALIGCGGRGTGAAGNAMKAAANVKLVAMADAFRDRLDSSYRTLTLEGKFRQQLDVPEERRFVGLHAYQEAIDADVDMALLCSPPGFRPAHFEAAVRAGKHVFAEKPVATDAPGVRSFMTANSLAKKKGLLVAVGHHLRHEKKHQEIVRQIREGAIGQLTHLRAYFNSAGVWVRDRKPDDSEMRYQVRNWYYFTWLSGDHIVEQHVHDLDVCNWMMNAHPVEAQGIGGREVRKGNQYGEIFDHHTVEFTYASGTKLFSFCRHMPGCWNSFSQHAHGTKGVADIEGHGRAVLSIDQRSPIEWRREKAGHQTEHDDLFSALMAGRTYNEGDYGASSTMTAILGRMATYSGRVVHWNEAINSPLDLAPPNLSWDADPRVLPDQHGYYASAVPGVSKAW